MGDECRLSGLTFYVFPQILKEALRMHGPAFGTIKCSPPDGITLNGYHVPAGTELSVTNDCVTAIRSLQSGPQLQ